MSNKFIKQLDVLSDEQFNAKTGRILGLWLIFEGTNQSGETGALSDLGSMNIYRGEEQIYNVDMDSQGEIDDLRFGGLLFSSTTAAAFEVSIFIPFFESNINDMGYQNALAIAGKEEMNISWSPADDGTVFASISCKVYQKQSSYPERYQYSTLRNNPTVEGALAGEPFDYGRTNISAFYLSDPDDVVSLVALEQNGRNVYTPQPWNVLLADTLLFNNLEVADYDFIELQCYTQGVPASSRNKNSTIYLTTSGSGNVKNVFTQLKWWDKSR